MLSGAAIQLLQLQRRPNSQFDRLLLHSLATAASKKRLMQMQPILSISNSKRIARIQNNSKITITTQQHRSSKVLFHDYNPIALQHSHKFILIELDSSTCCHRDMISKFTFPSRVNLKSIQNILLSKTYDYMNYQYVYVTYQTTTNSLCPHSNKTMRFVQAKIV